MRTCSTVVCVLLCSIAMLPSIACGQEPVVPNATEPSPDLTPEQVITIQLNALKNNDRPSPDHGIGITFNFASPGNKAFTGPLARFIRMVKDPVYRPMLNHRSYAREAVETFGDMARQRVTIVDAGGRRIVYIFILSKQTEPPYEDCWMTDSVMRVVDESGPARVAGVLVLGCINSGSVIGGQSLDRSLTVAAGKTLRTNHFRARRTIVWSFGKGLFK